MEKAKAPKGSERLTPFLIERQQKMRQVRVSSLKNRNTKTAKRSKRADARKGDGGGNLESYAKSET